MQPTATLPVWQVEDVLALEGTQRLNTEKVAPHLSTLFEKSGARFIVTLFLSGVPGDFQLFYSLYQTDAIEKGVVFGDEAAKAFNEIAKILAKKTGRTLIQRLSHETSDFSDTLLANGIEAYNQGDFETAINYLTLTVEKFPENHTAARFLAMAYAEQGQFRRADQLVKHAIKDILSDSRLTEIEQQKQLGRMRFVYAKSLFEQKDVQLSQQLLDTALANTTTAVDLIYQAYVNELLGNIHFIKGNAAAADTYLQSATHLYSVLECPYGITRIQQLRAQFSKRTSEFSGATGRVTEGISSLHQHHDSANGFVGYTGQVLQ